MVGAWARRDLNPRPTGVPFGDSFEAPIMSRSLLAFFAKREDPETFYQAELRAQPRGASTRVTLSVFPSCFTMPANKTLKVEATLRFKAGRSGGVVRSSILPFRVYQGYEIEAQCFQDFVSDIQREAVIAGSNPARSTVS